MKRIKRKMSLIRSLVIFEAVGIAFFLAIFIFLAFIPSRQDNHIPTALASVNQSQQNSSASTTNQVAPKNSVAENIVPGLPLRLKIPKINVNAMIDSVGLTPQGTMGIPTVPSHAAWFKLGARPGEAGSAVISGHVNWYNGAYSIFLNLNKLKPGDKISILDDTGATISFVVRKSVTYGANQDATDIFSASDGLAHLNLITCSGTWDKIAKQYSKRLVVFTDKE